ncbi:MAG: pantetheine-phosphate adenylyltransferase [Anaerolineales bacterium]|nr:pantetheine-phosphate adenylyltransferase [Anaerolineales bacterium]MCB9128269.1 pantetheine-phosphate adenylyltransferase [Ardenticatenales bacterium]
MNLSTGSARTALFPGSFDPLTNGHLEIIERAAPLFDRLIVVVGYNPNKQSLFTATERQQFIRQSCVPWPNIEVDRFSQRLLVDYAAQVGATTVVRGLRDWRDFENEFQQAQMNRRMMPSLDTLFFLARTDERTISSRRVRALIQAGESVAHLVPPVVAAAVAQRTRP